MKTMTFHSDHGPVLAKTRGLLGDVATSVTAWLRKAGAALAAAHKTAQRARLAGTLARLTDDQLAQVGIKRSQIWSHVEKITADEYDGL